MIDLSVCIVNWNTKNFLENCLKSIYDNKGVLNIEVLVVDNNSSDGSIEMLEAKFPEVGLIKNKENIGFGRANNQAIRRSKGNFILLLNPDTIVTQEAIYKMYSFLIEHSNAGMAGPKILNSDGSIQYECAKNFPTPLTEFAVLSTLYKRFPKNKFFGHYLMTYWAHNEIREVDAISGACLMVKRSVLDQIGIFDEAFFMYGEDTDLCYRIKKAGLKIYFLPTAQIIHLWGKSTDQASYVIAAEARRSIELFFKKHYGIKAVIAHRIIAISVSIFIQLIICLIYLIYPKKGKLKNIFLRNYWIFKWAIGFLNG